MSRNAKTKVFIRCVGVPYVPSELLLDRYDSRRYGENVSRNCNWCERTGYDLLVKWLCKNTTCSSHHIGNMHDECFAQFTLEYKKTQADLVWCKIKWLILRWPRFVLHKDLCNLIGAIMHALIDPETVYDVLSEPQ